MKARRKKKGLKFDLSVDGSVRSPWTSFIALTAGVALLFLAVRFGLSHNNAVAAGTISNSSPASQPANESPSFAQDAQPYSVQFAKCAGSHRWTCVVDGDTIWLNGEKIRIADIDTPEISHPRCQQEYELGLTATQRLIDLLNEGEFSVTTSAWPDQDRFGRKLRLVVRGGSSLGEDLIREGLAHRWIGHKIPWC